MGATRRPSASLSLAAYRPFLPNRPDRRVVILADPGLGEELTTLVAEFAADDTYVLSSAASPDWGLEEFGATLRVADGIGQVNWVLKTIGPIDVIVDLLSGGSYDEVDVWGKLFLHLRPRGVYLMARRHSGQRQRGATRRLELFLQRHWLGEDDPKLSALDLELVESCRRFLCDRSYLMVEKRQRHLVKLRDAEVGRMLPRRNTRDAVTTIETRRGGDLACRGRVLSHEASVPILNMPTSVSYPELHLQHYEGKFALVSNQLLHGDSTVLPASFRYPLTATLGNPRLIDVSPQFARVPPEHRPRRELDGIYYHLDCWHSGHFGHFISEVVSRLWGWPEAKRRFPELQAVFRRRFPNDGYPTLETTIFTAFGIPAEDIVWVTEPTWLRSVVSATPMWQNVTPYYVHPDITDTWARIQAGLVTVQPESPSRIFISRRGRYRNRSCRNAPQVEAAFARHGFAVVYPEELSLPDQASLFGGATVVAGFAGSGLYNILYSKNLSTLIVLAHEAYSARYEHLYTMVLGCTTHYFWSTPDVQHPPGGWSEEAYYSSWEFDFSRNGEALDAVLTGLEG